MDFVTFRGICRFLRQRPATPAMQRLQAWHITGLGYFRFARRYSGNHCSFLFLKVLRCFSSSGSHPQTYVFSKRTLLVRNSRFPYSDILGSRVVCTSPWLFAAYHVLRRLREPRHPPYALTSPLLTESLLVFFSSAYLDVSVQRVCDCFVMPSA